MNRRRILLGCALACFYVYVVLRGARWSNDFRYPYIAARALWRTSQLHVSAQPRYPVSFHVLLAPLARLPIGVASAVWAALSFAAVAALPRTIEGLCGLPPRRQLLAWVVVLPSLIDALILGQSDPINLFLVASGLLAVRRGRAAAGVGLVGLAGMIKILPIVHWATILSRCRSRGVWIGMALTGVVALGIIASAVGWQGALSGIREQLFWIHDHEKPWHLVARGTDLRANNESLPIVLARTLSALGPVTPRHALGLALVPLDTIWRIWGGILAGLIVIWLVSARRSAALPADRSWLGMFALTSIVMLAGTPICWHHYFLWLLPATLFLIDRPRLLEVAVVWWVIATAAPAIRGVGGHMLLALGFFAAVARQMWLEAQPSEAANRAGNPHLDAETGAGPSG